jgi:hypothetical protein
MSLPSSYRSRRGHIHLPRVLPLVGCRSKTLTAGVPGRGSRRRSHGELDGFNLYQATVALNRGNTFVFGSWVCTADDTRSFQHHLTMTPNPRTGLVTLPEVITGDLAGKFGEISLFNQHTDFESGSASNSNSTSPWVTACEPATEPSCVDAPLHEHFPFGLCNASRAHAEALVARRAGKEIVSDYASNSNPAPATTRIPPTSSTSGRILTSPSPRTPRLSNHCQD